MNVVKALRVLNLDLLDDVWVNEALDFHATELPDSYFEFLQEVDINLVIREASVALNEWLCQTPSEDGILTNWSILLQHNLKRKALVALIGFMLTTAQSSNHDPASRLSSLLWSEFYFLLLAVPGSSACKVFDAIVYSKSLATFELVKLALGNNKKSAKSKKNRNHQERDNEDIECEASENVLTCDEKNKTIQGVNSLFKSFSFMLKSFSLRVNEMSLVNTVETLCNLTRVEGETSRYPRDYESQTCLQMVSCNSFLCLQCICSQVHGLVQENFKLITKHILPSILLKGAYGFEANFTELKNICSKAVHFLQFMIEALGEPAYEGIFLLVKHTCLKTVEKADYRHQGSDTVVLLLRSLPAKPHKELVKWLFVYSHQDKASYRLFGLEIISKLLFDKERSDEPPTRSNAACSMPEQQAVDNCNSECGENSALDILSSQERHSMLDKYFLAIIFGRCNDASSAVRAKALAVIADCMTLEYPDARDIMSAIFVTPYENVVSAYESDIQENGFMDHAYLIQCFDGVMNIDPLPGGKAVISLIKKIVGNTKVQVTKSALKVLENIVLMSEKWMSDNILEVMCQFCRSSSVVIRKNMIDCFTKLLLRYPRNSLLAKLWVKKVLMQVDDQESTVKEKAVQAACSALITNIVSADVSENPLSMLPWSLLSHIVDLNMKSKLISVCSLWLRENRAQTRPYNLLHVLQTHLHTEHRAAAWTMIRCLSSEFSSSSLKIPNPTFLYECYMTEIDDLHRPDSELVFVTILEIMHAWWKVLPEELWTALLDDMVARLEVFSIPNGLISPMMETTQTMMENSSEDGRERSRAFAVRLIDMCDKYLKTIMVDFVFWKNANSLETCLRHMITLGSAILVCPDAVKKETYRMLLQLTFPHTCKLPGAVELLQAQRQLAKVQISGMIALAKYGLVNDTSVKQIARLLADLLSSSKNADVKHNTILILTDLCGRYTSVVEPLLPSLYLCLKDGDRRIRRTMLISFIELLNTEYLKPKGALFLYLLTMLCDCDEEVKMYIKSYITKCLILKNKTVMSSNFPESLFFYNDYKGQDVPTQKNKNCKASLTVRIKKDSRNTRYRDPYIKEGLLAVINIDFRHSHLVNVAEAWKWLKRSTDTRDTFLGYFRDGMSPNTAIMHHENILMAEGVEQLMNSQRNPPQDWVYREHDKWQKENYGNLQDGDTFSRALAAKEQQFTEEGCTLIIQHQPLCISIVTPMMKSTLEQLNDSQSLYLDSTASCDQTNTYLTVALVGCN
ncbi:condensin-2 complex subunit D3-L-like isoform X1 [Bacillus rossius redtenbacheri]|uniref:condensin-2 complex subunit D3-L-like isoform X1 n=1 Tax=Bacillus rossius redtenbacheri TaxID=93214 RepID=UPI002FDD0775